MREATKEEICSFVERACASNSNDSLYLFTIDIATALKIKQYIPLTLTNYEVIITEDYVRHVRNSHKKDLEYICLIPEIITSFDKVHKTIEPNRRTNKTEIFAVFEKRYSDDMVKLVKLRDMREKILSLRTIFRKD